jgi:hypothetical protein
VPSDRAEVDDDPSMSPPTFNITVLARLVPAKSDW